MNSERLKHHRRSHSTSSSPIPRRSPSDSWRAATKRAQPFSPDLSSPQKWDVDLWRRGKRRRRNASDDSDSMDVDFGRPSFNSSPIPAPPTPAFAATSAEFSIFPRNSNTSNRKRRATHHNEFSTDLDSSARPADLQRLRSDAFWQLRRSVEENGEGFVKSMQVYESRRSRSSLIALKVKEAQRESHRRGRRRSPARADPTGLDEEGSEAEDDDVQIFAGEPVYTGFANRGKQRAFSAGGVDTEDKIRHSPSDRCSSPGATCDSRSSVYLSDDDGFHLPSPDTQVSPALSQTLSRSGNSSLISLDLPPSPVAPKAILASSRSEKAIAALTLAMANGAGGLDDYEALRSLHTFSPDNCQVGEMWH
ncbi:hypothetical protein R3P38DRAFT_2824275 [Favolaschia claudopus]|uniref:Uncharacterized protein n=1 Tax=Favolaschia claudopus TaxID=2862362 RepID=A0AAW0EHY8_9AGAR